MSERVKGRRVTVYQYDELEHLIQETETSFEPLDPRTPEFEGVLGTLDLPHGEVPVKAEGEVWSIHAVYQKNVIWVRRRVVEASAP